MLVNMGLMAATLNDLAIEASSEQTTAFGFPNLERDEIPTCGDPGFNQACTRSGRINTPLKNTRMKVSLKLLTPCTQNYSLTS